MKTLKPASETLARLAGDSAPNPTCGQSEPRDEHITAFRGLAEVLALVTVLILAPTANCFAQAKLESPVRDIDPKESSRLGRELVDRLISQVPARNVTNSGLLKLEGASGMLRSVPVHFTVVAEGSSWIAVYETKPTDEVSKRARVVIKHVAGQPNSYELVEGSPLDGAPRKLSGADTMIPFAGSDFWIADLGLEFLHWPEQKLLRKQIRKGQSCDVLESTNPSPKPGAYRRVVSWLDIDTGGIVHADAYDGNDRLLKQFDPKEITKVRGEWQLEEMEIRNRQAGSKTRIEFKLGQ